MANPLPDGSRDATAAEFKAMAHPLRLRILRLCLHEELTNKQLADRLGQEPATVLHHVRTLCRTGFLEPAAVRNGARGALEKPYRATGKSWSLSIEQPEDRLTSVVAGIDALREEMVAAGPEAVVRTTRLGLRLSTGELDELSARIDELIGEFAARRPTRGGDRFGFYLALHRLDPPAPDPAP